ncbi:hypothetical protein C8Q76DRAFT_606631 [Earliella scabrosa]|nr:hypothetical protein C8Q76DRAFT_606631 [Earliella scabrosa]
MLARQSLTRVCPCVGGRCLTASLSKAKETAVANMQRRQASTSTKYVRGTQSIFSSDVSPWDEIFEDIKSSPAALKPTTANLRSLKYSPASYVQDRLKAPRAVSMTRGEAHAFEDMFTQLFDANTDMASDSQFTAGIGQVRSASKNVLVGKLRQVRRARWTADIEEDLDRKREEMELCETDIQLLEWAMREVFGESERYEHEARLAATPEESSTSTPTTSTSPSSPAPPRHAGALQLQPASYPFLLAALMRSFRDKYKDPHLALAMFDHARNLSVASFVFGCTTPAYNELIETRWRCFRDLRGVCDAMEEMRVNGIALDNRTRLLSETIRREVGERTLWQEESSLGSGEVWEMVARLDRLAKRDAPKRRRSDQEKPATVRKRKWSSQSETWKERAMDIGAKEDNWAFDRWGPMKARDSAAKEKRPMRY